MKVEEIEKEIRDILNPWDILLVEREDKCVIFTVEKNNIDADEIAKLVEVAYRNKMTLRLTTVFRGDPYIVIEYIFCSLRDEDE
jgi:hypothetical protein